MTITIRLNEEEEKKLRWLLQNANKEPKAYRDQTISDIVRIAINNEWASCNLDHYEYDEKDQCDELWLKQTKKS